jgi:tetratricopeptide (TPR) repeat protein
MYLKAAELDPLSARILAGVGIALEFQGRFEEALAWYKRAYEIDPMQDLVSLRMGEYHWSVLGELDQAVVWFRRAAFIDPDYSGNIVPLGYVFLDLGNSGEAAYWIERSIEINPEWINVMVAMSDLHLYRGDEAAAANQARKALAVSPRDWGALNSLRIHELRAGRYAEARALYEKAYPELLSDDDPTVGRMNFGPAVDLALVLFNTSEKERADLLLEKSLRYIRTKPRFGRGGYRLTDVQIFALQGKKQKALAALRQAIDEGWRAFWWYWLKEDPTLESLHDEPEFQAMVAEIEADMAAQLARVREMERNGELEPIPEISATTH